MNNVAVILAGGRGTRISEESKVVPKPMIYLDDKPILHHLIDEFVYQGVKDFIILSGYKQEIIYGYFYVLANNVFKSNGCTTFQVGNLNINLVPSGLESQTGGRLLFLKDIIRNDFFLTYGDGLSDINLQKVLDTHKQHNALATISSVRPAPRFGDVIFDESGRVTEFDEKRDSLRGWINGGFAVISPEILSYISSEQCNLEKDVYPELVQIGKLYTVPHYGFWHCVDTIRDLENLTEIYNKEGKIWLK